MISFITSNSHKFQEIKQIMENYGIQIRWINMKYEEVQAQTTEEVSADSAHKLADFVDAPFFIEDTGLYIRSLKGFPGPFSSYVFATIGNQGILHLLEHQKRDAEFRTVVTFFDGKGFFQFTGTLRGSISTREAGNSGFGYDPIFIPEGSEKTLGEMSLHEKNAVSHRAAAITKLIDHLKNAR
ncbi:MAG TPA: XTP/dITP diphosphatase [Thermoplasmataceae archaeon]|nr:XTP/dITP diphosphatase [Thermoplasmatales archaeon AK]HLH86051.1 XTP/dITP diphosphatase [Thermoplasmataceae archaeon]